MPSENVPANIVTPQPPPEPPAISGDDPMSEEAVEPPSSEGWSTVDKTGKHSGSTRGLKRPRALSTDAADAARAAPLGARQSSVNDIAPPPTESVVQGAVEQPADNSTSSIVNAPSIAPVNTPIPTSTPHIVHTPVPTTTPAVSQTLSTSISVGAGSNAASHPLPGQNVTTIGPHCHIPAALRTVHGLDDKFLMEGQWKVQREEWLANDSLKLYAIPHGGHHVRDPQLILDAVEPVIRDLFPDQTIQMSVVMADNPDGNRDAAPCTILLHHLTLAQFNLLASSNVWKTSSGAITVAKFLTDERETDLIGIYIGAVFPLSVTHHANAVREMLRRGLTGSAAVADFVSSTYNNYLPWRGLEVTLAQIIDGAIISETMLGGRNGLRAAFIISIPSPSSTFADKRAWQDLLRTKVEFWSDRCGRLSLWTTPLRCKTCKCVSHRTDKCHYEALPGWGNTPIFPPTRPGLENSAIETTASSTPSSAQAVVLDGGYNAGVSNVSSSFATTNTNTDYPSYAPAYTNGYVPDSNYNAPYAPYPFAPGYGPPNDYTMNSGSRGGRGGRGGGRGYRGGGPGRARGRGWSTAQWNGSSGGPAYRGYGYGY